MHAIDWCLLLSQTYLIIGTQWPEADTQYQNTEHRCNATQVMDYLARYSNVT